MDTTRLEAFSDGVFAIAITLLVLNLPIPSTPAVKAGQLAGELRHHWPYFAAYVVSFLVIGIMWVNHHYLFRLIAQVDRPLLFINLLLLMAVAVLPFPTGLLAQYITGGSANSHVAAAVYSGTMLAIALCFIGLWLWVTRPDGDLLHSRIDPVQARGARLRFGFGTFVYLLTVALSFVNAVVTLGLHFVIAVYYVFDHLPAGPGPDPDANPNS